MNHLRLIPLAGTTALAALALATAACVAEPAYGPGYYSPGPGYSGYYYEQDVPVYGGGWHEHHEHEEHHEHHDGDREHRRDDHDD